MLHLCLKGSNDHHVHVAEHSAVVTSDKHDLAVRIIEVIRQVFNGITYDKTINQVIVYINQPFGETVHPVS
jgi:hypothetical protein